VVLEQQLLRLAQAVDLLLGRLDLGIDLVERRRRWPVVDLARRDLLRLQLVEDAAQDAREVVALAHLVDEAALAQHHAGVELWTREGRTAMSTGAPRPAGRARRVASGAAHIAELDEPDLTERVDDRQRCVVLYDQLDQLHLLLATRGSTTGVRWRSGQLATWWATLAAASSEAALRAPGSAIASPSWPVTSEAQTPEQLRRLPEHVGDGDAREPASKTRDLLWDLEVVEMARRCAEASEMGGCGPRTPARG